MSASEKPKTIHYKKLFRGKETEEVYRKFAFPPGARCECGGPPALMIRTFALLKDLVEKDPEMYAVLAAKHDMPSPPAFRSKHGPMTMLGMTTACDLCRQTAAKAAAKLPSWVIVDVAEGDRRPEPDRPMVQVKGDS